MAIFNSYVKLPEGIANLESRARTIMWKTVTLLQDFPPKTTMTIFL